MPFGDPPPVVKEMYGPWRSVYSSIEMSQHQLDLLTGKKSFSSMPPMKWTRRQRIGWWVAARRQTLAKWIASDWPADWD